MTTGRLDDDLLPTLRAGRRPVLFAHATVRTLDPRTEDLPDADVLVADGAVVRVGTGLQDDGALLVDCSGLTLLPAVVGAAGPGPDRVGSLAPGSPATFGVVRTARPGPLEKVVWYTADAVAVVVDGVPRQWNGRRLADRVDEPVPAAAPVAGAFLGAWVDERRDVVQELTADGRYDETRSGRRHAYQGSYWVEGERVVYRDDLGFWAYGRFRNGVLDHADFVFRRR